MELPNGLANSSGELGHNLMDHIKGGGALGTIPGNEDRMVLGRRPNGTYVPRFRNLKKKDAAFLRGYGFQGGGQREGWQRGVTETGLGPEFNRLVSRPGPWRFSFYGYGECLPNHANYVERDKEKVDAWGNSGVEGALRVGRE
jgi:hypothetical protein